METIQKYDLPPSLLHLEITESAYTESPQQIMDTVRRLRKLGFVIEMDDFGSGYSSLNMLSKMPVDILKLDLKFVQSEIEVPGSEGILQFIMNLARMMNLTVVAEGVETRRQLERLAEIGCDCVQGYYFAKPMPVEEFDLLLKRWRAGNQRGIPDMERQSAEGGEAEKTQDSQGEEKSVSRMRQQQELLNDVIAGGMIGGYIKDGLPYCFIDPKLLEYLGYQQESEFAEDTEGQIVNCIHPGDRESVILMLNDQLTAEKKSVLKFRMKTRTGAYIWFRGTARAVSEDGGRRAFILICLDITNEKKMQEQIRDMYEKELAYFAELCSADGSHQGVLNVSQNRLETYHFTAEEGIAQEREAYTFVLEMREERGLRVKRFQVFYVSRELGQVCMTRTDVTDVVAQEQKQRNELAAALTAAKKASAVKSEFLSRMSHELRTPMNAIIGMNTIAASGLAKALDSKENIDTGLLLRQAEEALNCTTKINASSQVLLQLINDILDMSCIESGRIILKREKIAVREFLEDINSICCARAAEKGGGYEYITDPKLEDYYIGDAAKLKQILIHVLSNAVKFTDSGGKIKFSVMQTEKANDKASLRFVVSDTGVGMSDEFIPSIFDSFTQESTGMTALYGGTGLGMALAKGIVKMMGGKITLHSDKGSGTECTVDIKLSILKDAADYDFTGRRILLVEDNPLNTEVARAILMSRGFIVETAEHGLKAVELFRKSDTGYYNAILMDIRMPYMDGITAAREIRHLGNDDAGGVPIIAMSANSFSEDADQCREAGMNAHLSKPIDPDLLFQTLYDCIFEKDSR